MARQIKQKAMTFVDGILLPDIQSSWEDKLQEMRQMKLRDDDVFLFTYPKSGTNWLWEVITMLRKGRPEDNENIMWQFMVEITDIDKLQEMESPRTLCSHFPVSLLPAAELKARRLKVVHVYRNPKDTCVSLYTFLKSADWDHLGVPTDTFEEFFEHYFFSGKQLNGPYFRHIQQVHEFHQQNPDVPFFSLSFEDTKRDPVGCVKKLAQFLCLTVSDELCAQIAQACSFDTMKEKEAKKATPDYGNDNMVENPPAFCRKGQIGDWKN